MGLNALARDLHKWITRNEYGELEGYTKGGHLKYRLANGSMYFTPSSPSDQHGPKNAQRDIRKILGVKKP